MYYKEIEQKEAINSRISFPIGIVTLLTGGLVYLIQQNKPAYSVIFIFFYISFVLYFVNILVSLFFAYKAYYG